MQVNFEKKIAQSKGASFWGDNSPKVLYFSKVLQQHEMSALYAAADALIQPSRSEGWGLAVTKAMARGLPVVLANYGSQLDFVSNETAFLFDAAR